MAGKKIAVAVGYYSHSLTSRTKNRTWKNSSPLEATSVISIPNTTASSFYRAVLGSCEADLQEPKTKDMKEMEENVKISLDDMPIVQIQR